MSTDYIESLEAENAALRQTLREIKDGSQMLLDVGLTGSYQKYCARVLLLCTTALEQPK